MPHSTARAFGWVEQGLVPDRVIRLGIRRLLKDRLDEMHAGDAEAAEQANQAFIDDMRRAPIALVPGKANEQHYEVPADFFASVLAGRIGGTAGHPLRRAAGWALLAAACLSLMAVLPGRLGIFVIMAMGFPTAMYNAVLPAWMSERFAEHGQGRIMGLLSTIFCISNVVVALTGGWVALASTRWMMAFGGVAAVGAALLMLRLARTESRAYLASAG